MITIVGILVCLIFGIFLAYVAVDKKEILIVRELVISAPVERIFPYISNSKRSDNWMPWVDSDPDVNIVYSGPEEGLGAKSSWVGKKMGVGTSEITECIQNKKVCNKLTYSKPFVMTQYSELLLITTEKGTLVKWSVRGNPTFVFRLMGMFLNFDKMIGSEFEKGLNKLKFIAEEK